MEQHRDGSAGPPKPLACLDTHSAGTVQALSIANGKVYVATSLSGRFVLRVGEGE